MANLDVGASTIVPVEAVAVHLLIHIEDCNRHGCNDRAEQHSYDAELDQTRQGGEHGQQGMIQGTKVAAVRQALGDLLNHHRSQNIVDHKSHHHRSPYRYQDGLPCLALNVEVGSYRYPDKGGAHNRDK